MYTSTDVKGVLRRQCRYENSCECDGYTRSLTDGGQPGAPYQAAWCAYCGHSPVNHVRLGPSQPSTSAATLTAQGEAPANLATGSSAQSLCNIDEENEPSLATTQRAERPGGRNETGNIALSQQASTSETSTSETQVEKELRSLTGQHVCSQCGFFCTAFSTFASHTKTHRGVNVMFVCSMCNSHFAYLTHYQQHHKVCRKKWTDQSNLRQKSCSNEEEAYCGGSAEIEEDN
ncbi:zinc finger protein 133-like [Dermacentor silvarum]|uniref:zinc finger protein 133-like n=1 Tax=Dermacentor silvarum TaxID=543639 RepID=UPI0021015D10|nr:zinc finger protein 133-like [Dermacentor silvarum]